MVTRVLLHCPRRLVSDTAKLNTIAAMSTATSTAGGLRLCLHTLSTAATTKAGANGRVGRRGTQYDQDTEDVEYREVVVEDEH